MSLSTLMEHVWDDNPPTTALDTLQTYLSRLRGRLKSAVGDLAQLEHPTQRHYQLRVAPEAVDLFRFQQLRTGARTAAERGNAERAIALLRQAEGLWRGEPFAEFTGTWAVTARRRLAEDHRSAREERIQLELGVGRHADLIGELRELTAEDPLAEQTVAALMLALYRCGRHSEALALYRTTHQRLSEELGTSPGPELQQLHQRILTQDDTLQLPRPTATATATHQPPPSNLPRDTQDFTGRTSELRTLLAERSEDSTALPVTVLHGMPGVGKTALAIHAAYLLRDRYPSGHFYVDLRAYSQQPPHDPAEALATLLQTAKVPPADAHGSAPDSLDTRAARWRDWTARNRALVILDNARDADQVLPLLPGAPSCRAIVTSRNRLTLDGADELALEVPTAAEAAALFTRIAGANRISDATTLREVVDLCGCHPLSVNLTARRFRHRGSWDIQDLAEQLTQTADPLDELDDRITATFQLSYAALAPAHQRLFRYLTLHPGADITLCAATALTGMHRDAVRRGMEALLDCHLLEELVRGHHRLHDLVRAFGQRLCREEEPEAARDAAVHRLLAYYVTSADRADRLVHPHRRRLPVDAARRSPCAHEFADADEASVWLEMERVNLVAAARKAATDAPAYAVLFPHVLAESLKLWGEWDTITGLHRAAAHALPAHGDQLTLAQNLVEQADVLYQQDPGAALRRAGEALSVYRTLDDTQGRADATFQSGRAHLAAGHGDMALQVLDEALRLHREVGDRFGEAECLNIQGVALHYAGDYAEALSRFQAVLSIQREVGNLHGQAKAANNMGDIARIQGRYEEAQDFYEQSLALVRRFGGRQEFAILDTNLGAIYSATGQVDRALASFHRALTSYQASGHAKGEASTLIRLGATYAETGRTSESLLHFTMAERIARSIGDSYEHQRALVGVATAQRTCGQLAAATETYGQAIRVAQKIDFPLGLAHALAGLARTTLSTQGIEAARRYGEQAAATFQRLGLEEEARTLRHDLSDRGATGS